MLQRCKEFFLCLNKNTVIRNKKNNRKQSNWEDQRQCSNTTKYIPKLLYLLPAVFKSMPVIQMIFPVIYICQAAKMYFFQLFEYAGPLILKIIQLWVCLFVPLTALLQSSVLLNVRVLWFSSKWASTVHLLLVSSVSKGPIVV